jgi:integral membrane protein
MMGGLVAPAEIVLRASVPMHPMGRVFAVVALFEAFTWAGLLVGMYLKYNAAEPTTAGVALFGPVHGVAFMVYVVVTVLAAVKLRWPWWAAGLALLAAIPPLVTLPLEWWFKRRGLLAAR